MRLKVNSYGVKNIVFTNDLTVDPAIKLDRESKRGKSPTEGA